LRFGAGVSGPTQHALAAVLSDSELVARYLKESRERLARAYDAVAAALARARVPFAPCSAAIFVWADM
jgi:DNA-binding transcriptional MocR family regulator